MEQLTAIAALSIITEALVEYITYKLPRRLVPSWLKFYAAMATGMALCLVYNVDLMPLLSLESLDVIGPLITGVLIGRGSNVASDLFKRLRITAVPAAPVDEVLQKNAPRAMRTAGAK